MGHIQANIYHFARTHTHKHTHTHTHTHTHAHTHIWEKFHFFIPYCPFYSLEQSQDINLHKFGPELSKKCQFSPKEDFLGNFTPVNLSCEVWKKCLRADCNKKGIIIWPKIGQKNHLSDFYQHVIPYHAAKFEKNC